MHPEATSYSHKKITSTLYCKYKHIKKIKIYFQKNCDKNLVFQLIFLNATKDIQKYSFYNPITFFKFFL